MTWLVRRAAQLLGTALLVLTGVVGTVVASAVVTYVLLNPLTRFVCRRLERRDRRRTARHGIGDVVG